MKSNQVKPIPDGYHTVTPYLVIEKAGQVMDFLKKAFGAKEIYRHENPDSTIRHAELQIGDSRIMFSEASGSFKPMPSMLVLYVEDMDTLYKQAIAAGAKSLREPTNEFYGDRSAGVLDMSGNQWWISTHVEDVSPEEMKKREEAMAKK